MQFEGERKGSGCIVHIRAQDGSRKKLPLHLRVVNHSPSGFEWGYGGSGPAQLALAVTIASFPEKSKAWCVGVHQFVKRKLIQSLPGDHWVLSVEDVRKAALEAQNAVEDPPQEW